MDYLDYPKGDEQNSGKKTCNVFQISFFYKNLFSFFYLLNSLVDLGLEDCWKTHTLKNLSKNKYC